MLTRLMTPYQVAIATEAVAASVLAHAGCDVSIQYGANQPGYDVIATKGQHALKVSVKGSQDGGWGLIQSYKRGASYAEAAEAWRRGQRPDIVFCLVQYQGVIPGAAPRMYFAWPAEISTQLKAARGGLGNTILYEHYVFKKGEAAGKTDKLPDSWWASSQRIAELFARIQH